MKLGTVKKQPRENFSYTVTYEDALTVGDNVQAVEVVSVPTGLVITNVAVFDPRVKFWVGGGTDGSSYKLSITVTTADGRVFQDELTFVIKEVV